LVVSPFTDAIARGEELPFLAESFNVVLCVQVLEHVRHPARLVAEIGRVLRPGGTVVLTTHGTFFYHPVPEDLWRWTHEGLRLLFERTGPFGEIDVRPILGTFSALALLNAKYLDAALSRMTRGRLPGLRTVGKVLRAGVAYSLNWLGPWLDRQVPDFSRLDKQGTLFLSYLVVSTRAAPKSEQHGGKTAVSEHSSPLDGHGQADSKVWKATGGTALDA
jgi:SAM-dependent methyltransferase